MITLRHAVLVLIVLLAACGARDEPQLMTALNSPDPDVVVEALSEIEDVGYASTSAQRRIIELVKDSRPEVRRRSARVLGAIHAPVDAATVAAIGAMLESRDDGEVVDALKALRGMPSRSEIPRMLPLLKHPDEHVVRDTCRTLGAVADAAVVPDLEPLLKSRNEEIRADAQAALAKLRHRR